MYPGPLWSSPGLGKVHHVCHIRCFRTLHFWRRISFWEPESSIFTVHGTFGNIFRFFGGFIVESEQAFMLLRSALNVSMATSRRLASFTSIKVHQHRFHGIFRRNCFCPISVSGFCQFLLEKSYSISREITVVQI